MKVKIVGFKVDMGRPTYNRVVEVTNQPTEEDDLELVAVSTIMLGKAIRKALTKSDFLSVRRVDECLPTT